MHLFTKRKGKQGCVLCFMKTRLAHSYKVHLGKQSHCPNHPVTIHQTYTLTACITCPELQHFYYMSASMTLFHLVSSATTSTKTIAPSLIPLQGSPQYSQLILRKANQPMDSKINVFI